MRSYRLYCFDGASRITAVHEVQSRGDAEAILVAGHIKEGLKSELWERDRLVRRFDHLNRSSQKTLSEALEKLEAALQLLDGAAAPAHIGAHVDLAVHALREAIRAETFGFNWLSCITLCSEWERDICASS